MKLHKSIIRWFKTYYWNVRYDLPADRQRTKKQMLLWVFYFPWYRLLSTLARAGFLNTPEGVYMRLRDFTPFFWRTLVERAKKRERNHWKYEMSVEHDNNLQLLETARREAREEVFEWFEEHITSGQ